MPIGVCCAGPTGSFLRGWQCDGIESSANRCEICLPTTSKWREREMNDGTNCSAHVVNLYLCK